MAGERLVSLRKLLCFELSLSMQCSLNQSNAPPHEVSLSLSLSKQVTGLHSSVIHWQRIHQPPPIGLAAPEKKQAGTLHSTPAQNEKCVPYADHQSPLDACISFLSEVFLVIYSDLFFWFVAQIYFQCEFLGLVYMPKSLLFIVQLHLSG